MSQPLLQLQQQVMHPLLHPPVTWLHPELYQEFRLEHATAEYEQLGRDQAEEADPKDKFSRTRVCQPRLP